MQKHTTRNLVVVCLLLYSTAHNDHWTVSYRRLIHGCLKLYGRTSADLIGSLDTLHNKG